MHQLERKILRLSTIVLFLSLLVVYALFYQVKRAQIKTQLSWEVDQNSTQIYVKDWDEKKIIWSLESNEVDTQLDELIITWTLKKTNHTGNVKILTWNTLNKTNKGLISNEIKYLSWTQLFYWILESIEKLWIAYKYVLQDKKGIYYIYLWDFKYDIASIARKLKWNVYVINTEQEILKNKLFGDKVMFINLPEYKNKVVLMLVYIDSDAWLLQVDYTLYHKSKTYLQSLFID